MDKRYQVFVSSTYADLREERQRVIQALMEMDCIPSGMELFPAADEEQWQFIKRVIDDCDYYLLIIGGRYGSTTPEGISYTEKEYDYAINKGIRVVALLHANPEEIPMGKSEIDPELRERLKVFRKKVSSNRLVKFWTSANELPGLVALSLSKTIKMYPAIGWMRADQVSSAQLLSEINELRKTKEEMQLELASLRGIQETELTDLASLDSKVAIFGLANMASDRVWRCEKTWGEFFAILAPYLLEQLSDYQLRGKLAEFFCQRYSTTCAFPKIDDEVWNTAKIQYQALGFIKLDLIASKDGVKTLYWSLTPKGYSAMMSLRTIRSK